MVAGAGLWYVTTDSGFRSLILPRVATAMGEPISASRAEWSPFSLLILENVQVGKDPQPLLKAKKLVIRYDGRAFLRGNYLVESITADGAVIYLVKDSRTPSSAPGEASKSSPGAATHDTMPSFSIGSISAQDLGFTYVSPTSITRLEKVRLQLNGVKPGGSISLNLQGEFTSSSSSSPAEAAVLQALTSPPPQRIAGQLKMLLDVEVDPHFLPKSAKGDVLVDRVAGAIGGQSLNELSGIAKIDLSSSPNGSSILKEARISIERNGAILTSLSARGPFDATRKEAELDIQAGPIQSNLLNLFFAASGVDFMDTSIGYAGHLSISKGGSILSAKGKLDANPLNLSHSGIPSGAWKPVVLTVDHALELDFDRKQTLIQTLNIDAAQSDKPLLHGNLSKPMALTWGDGKLADGQMGQADFTLQIYPLDVAPLAPFLGLPKNYRLISSVIAGNASVVATDQGRNLTFEGHGLLSNIEITSEKMKLADVTAAFDGKMKLASLRTLQFQPLTLKITRQNRPLANATVAGTVDLSTRTGNGLLQFEGPLVDLLAIRPIAGVDVSTGTLGGSVDWKLQEKNHFTCQMDLSARDLGLQTHGIRYEKTTLALSTSADMKGDVLKLDDAKLIAQIGNTPAGTWSGNLTYNTATDGIQMAYKLQDWKEAILAPLLTAWMPERKLRSAEITGLGDLSWQMGTLNLKSTTSVKNLVVESPGSVTPKPLNATVTTDLSQGADGTMTFRSLGLQLDPTPSAKNSIVVSGSMKNTPTLNFKNLKVQGSSIDATPYYDQLFSTTPAATTATSPTAPTATVPAPRVAAPNPVRSDVTIALMIDSVRVRDFVVTDVNATYRQKDNSIELPATRFKIGEAPFTATISSEQSATGSSPFRFEAAVDGLALGPIVDVLRPDLRSLVGGAAKIKFYGQGKGLSVPELQQNLDAYLEVAIRQAHLEKVPALQKALTKLAKLLAAPDIEKVPLDNVDASAHIAGGKLHTDNFHLGGSQLEATLRGDIFLADQRLQMDTLLKIHRDLMAKSQSLLQVAGGTSGEWFRLPPGIGFTGPLSDPQPNIDQKFYGGVAGNAALNILKGILPPTNTNAPPTQAQPGQPPSQQPTPQNPVEDLLNGLFKKKKKN